METDHRVAKHTVQLRKKNQRSLLSFGCFSTTEKRTSGMAKRLIVAAASFWLPLVGVASTSTPKALEEASNTPALQTQLKQMKSAYAFYSSIAQQGGWKPLDEDSLLKYGALRQAAADGESLKCCKFNVLRRFLNI